MAVGVYDVTVCHVVEVTVIRCLECEERLELRRAVVIVPTSAEIVACIDVTVSTVVEVTVV